MENKETFHYTYSAKEQAEIQAIRQKYTVQTQEEDKMALLRRLDAAVAQKAMTVSLTLGIIGTLVMGTGMSFAMTQIGDMLGISEGMALLVGVIVGIFGMGIAGIAYPVHNRILTKEREKIAPEIIRLTDELMK